jgi:hypothetical protein
MLLVMEEAGERVRRESSERHWIAGESLAATGGSVSVRTSHPGQLRDTTETQVAAENAVRLPSSPAAAAHHRRGPWQCARILR